MAKPKKNIIAKLKSKALERAATKMLRADERNQKLMEYFKNKAK
jgi:hypothetical protein